MSVSSASALVAERFREEQRRNVGELTGYVIDNFLVFLGVFL